MGSDCAGVSGLDLVQRADKKVFRVGEFLIGFTTSFRMGQLLQYSLRLPSVEDDLHRYMVTKFVDAVRECLKAGGYAKKENEVEEGGTFLVGVRGRLFKVVSDYQVGESLYPYDAAGCGEAYALGALAIYHGLQSVLTPNIDLNNHVNPEYRIRHALGAAQSYSAGVRGPFHIEKLEASI